jgi:hypothetical protein
MAMKPKVAAVVKEGGVLKIMSGLGGITAQLISTTFLDHNSHELSRCYGPLQEAGKRLIGCGQQLWRSNNRVYVSILSVKALIVSLVNSENSQDCAR